MRILITGARAPACLEWARLLRSAGCTVAVADSCDAPLTRFSSCVERWFRLPVPVRDVNKYGEALLSAAETFRADCILPTCEEAFYIAHQKRRLEMRCRVFVAEFELMRRLHDKGAFAELSRTLPLAAPRTIRLESVAQLMVQAGCSRELVFKPAYSRFAALALIRPAPRDLRKIQPSPENPWIAQQFINGNELCSYSLLRNGRLLAHSCYHPKYRVGQGSGIYLEPVQSRPTVDFVAEFGRKTGYSGQVGFDFIQSADTGLFVLECNPRATSGIHLFHGQSPQLAAMLQSLQQAPANGSVLVANGSPRMVSVAMALYAAPGLRKLSAWREFVGDWRRATDIISAPLDRRPVLAQLLGLLEIHARAIRLGRRPLLAATYDIEWNGQPLGAQP